MADQHQHQPSEADAVAREPEHQPPAPSNQDQEKFIIDALNHFSLKPFQYPLVTVPPFTARVTLEPRLKIVTYGDSLTQQAAFPNGFHALLAARYQRTADLYNRGYSGYNTRHALVTLKQHLHTGIWPYTPSGSTSTSTIINTDTDRHSQPHYKQLVTLCFGANDCVIEGSPAPCQHVPVAEYEQNIRQMIQLLVPEYSQISLSADTAPSHYLSSDTALILVTPPQIDEPKWRAYRASQGGPSVKTRDVNTGRLYADAVVRVGQLWQIPVVNLWALTPPVDDAYSYFEDGLHLNTHGNKVTFEAIVDTIDRHYPSLSVNRVVLDAPDWMAWDFDSPSPAWPQSN